MSGPRRPRGYNANGGGTQRHACVPRSHVFNKHSMTLGTKIRSSHPGISRRSPRRSPRRRCINIISVAGRSCRGAGGRQFTLPLPMGVGKWRGVGCWGFGAAAGGLMKTCDRGVHACLGVPPPFASCPRGRRACAIHVMTPSWADQKNMTFPPQTTQDTEQKQ